MVKQLNEGNFLLYAAKHYDNPQCYDQLEFVEDLNRFKYLKRLFNKYKETGEIKERLILNHLIIIYNVFGVEVGNRMLFFKLKEYLSLLKPFLIFMNNMPEQVYNEELNVYFSSDIIELDNGIIKKLREIRG